MKDFFEDQEKLPSTLVAIFEKYEDEDFDYRVCKALLEEVEQVGWTFDYGLDAVPYDLTLKEGKKTLAVIDQNNRIIMKSTYPDEWIEKSFNMLMGVYEDLIEDHGSIVSNNTDDVTSVKMVWLALGLREDNIHIWREMENDINLAATLQKYETKQ